MRRCTQCGEEKKLERFVRQKGKYRSDPYTRRCKECKNSKRRTGKQRKDFQKGHIPWNKGKKCLTDAWNKGKKLTAEHIEKIASKIRGRGKGRWTYNYHIWRKKVFERDENQCVKCGNFGRLHAHHIVPWKENIELRFDVNNGKTYCRSCHMSIEPRRKKIQK